LKDNFKQPSELKHLIVTGGKKNMLNDLDSSGERTPMRPNIKFFIKNFSRKAKTI